MLSFKEFVLKRWELRKELGAPTGDAAEKSFEMWKVEGPHNGWWRQYVAWQNLGSPFPLEDINYEKLTVDPKPKMLTFEEFFVAKMKANAPGINWTFEDHFPKQWEQHVTSWKESYDGWLAAGCPPIVSKFSTVQQKPVPEKKKIRYLNRVDA